MLDTILEFRKTFAASAKFHKSKNAYLGVVCSNVDGMQVLKTLGEGPCHGGFQTYQLTTKIPNSLKIDYLFSSVQNILVDKIDADKYIFWLANKSPWKDVFVTKDVEDIKTLGWVIDPKFPANFVASACIATRFITETYNNDIVARFPVYKEILSFGFSEEFAMIFAFSFYKARSSSYAVNASPLSNGHCVFDFTYAEEDYFNHFIKGSPQNLLENTFQKSRGYDSQVCAVWSKGSDRESKFKKWIASVRPLTAKDAINLNIFEKTDKKGFVITSPEAFKNVLLQIQERLSK